MDLKIESTTLYDFPRQNYGNKPHGNNKIYLKYAIHKLF